MNPPLPQEKTDGPMPEKTDAPMTIKPGERDRSLAAEVRSRSGTNFNCCFQCRSCGNGCPFIQAMDHPPNVLLRMVQYGMDREVLESETIWVCAGCHTCSSQCPMAIDLAGVMNTLRIMAMERGAAVAKPNILKFHEEVLGSLKRYGRAHKLGIMWRYKLKTRRWFSDMDTGLKMLAKRKLELRPSRVKAIKEIEDLFQHYWRKGK
ncbi:MAG: heterodisulfide reductase [Deltaproteobacteria bacterium]|nr:MAG: heterodisulfide reductase [Deltaproteobacteria bacterium]